MRFSWWVVAILIMLWVCVLSIPGIGIQENWVVTAFLASALAILIILWIITLL